MAERIYFDYNATAPLRPEITAAIPRWLAVSGNPSSVHAEGRVARAMVEDARCAVGQLVGAEPQQVIFCASGTEANHLALNGCASQTRLVSAIEHESVRVWAGDRMIPVGGDGRIDTGKLAALLASMPKPTLVSVMLANNETGILQPVAECAAIAHAAGALIHCDGVQAAGRVPVDFDALGVDLLSLSAHKLGGLKGAGALVLRSTIMLQPVLRGGGQEGYRRAGTEAVLPIAAFGLAARLARANLTEEAAVMAGLRWRLESGLPACVRVIGQEVSRLPNTSCLAIAGQSAETVTIALDLAGVAVSAGAACSSGKVRASPVLHAMGLGDDIARSAIRVSLGPGNCADEIDRVLTILHRFAMTIWRRG